MLARPIIQQFTQFPTPIEVAMYAEAAASYARRVSNRALAVYQVGSVHYPGLSDLDLLVVVRDSKSDNRQFFSVRTSIGERFRELFLHEPFILPYDCLECLRYTSHARRKLLGGSDLAAAFLPDTSYSEMWCKLLEGLCTYHSYFTSVARTQTVRVRHMTAVASSMRFTLGQCDAVIGSSLAPSYSTALDALKSELTADWHSQSIAERTLNQFYETFLILNHTTHERLTLPAGEDLVSFAKRALAGERDLPNVDRAWVAERSKAIARYHHALLKLKIPYGFLFFLAAYGDGVTRYRQNRFAAKWFDGLYGLRGAFSK